MIKKIISLTVLTAMLISINFSMASANDKKQEAEVENKIETVYGVLQLTGVVKDVYIVNEFDVIKLGMLSDFGDYSSVKNLTNIEKISNEDEKVSAYSDEGKFYYQGDFKSKELPWKFDIIYTLDGKTVMPDKLSGKSGNLEISINTEKNDNVINEYYENYMLQITVTLHAENCEDLIVDNGMLASVGGSKIITFTSMPDQDLKCSLSANVTDFEMDGISINAVPFSFDLDMLDMDEFESGLTDLSVGVSKLNQGAYELRTGSLDINKGIGSLADGSDEFYKGLLMIDGSGQSIGEGSSGIKDALDLLNQQLQGMNNDELVAGLTGIRDGLTGISDGLEGIRLGMIQANQMMGAAVIKIPEEKLTDSQILALKGNPDIDQDVIDLLLDYYAAGVEVKATWAEANVAYSQSNIAETKAGIDNIILAIDQMILGSSNSGLDELVAGVNQLATKYAEFDDGLSKYLDGIGSSVNGYNKLNGGISDLSGQYNRFDGGVKSLADGISELNKSTKDLPNKIDEMMSEYDSTNYKPISYASEENEEIKALQFLLTTESIEIKKEEIAPDSQKEDLNFWERLIRLFIGD